MRERNPQVEVYKRKRYQDMMKYKVQRKAGFSKMKRLNQRV